MAETAPNAAFHYVCAGIKGANLTKNQYAQPLIGIRQTGFEDGNEIGTETDEGHTGTGTLDMGSYRTTAESAPTWQDKLRYAMGLEDLHYLLLGRVTKTAHETVEGVYNYLFAPTNNDLPAATIWNGFYQGATTDA